MRRKSEMFEVLGHRVSEHNHKEYDGRPRVDMFQDDPLLARLLEFHGEPRFDLYPGVKVSTEE